MAAEVQVTSDFQTAPIWDGTLKPGFSPAFINPGGVDVYLDDDPALLNTSAIGAIPNSGAKLAAGTLTPVVLFASTPPRKIYARAASRTTIMIL